MSMSNQKLKGENQDESKISIFLRYNWNVLYAIK
jgi:hypothetical protein